MNDNNDLVVVDEFQDASAIEIYNEVLPFLMSKQSIYYCYNRDMVSPVWDNNQPTAYVQFDPNNTAKNVKFGMNRQFMLGLNYNERCFVFIHEALHVLFNHGKRGEDFYNSLPKGMRSRQIINCVMDWCINDIIKRIYLAEFAFDLHVLDDCQTFENFEKKTGMTLERGHDFTYYYHIYVQHIKDNPSQYKFVRGCGDGDGIEIEDDSVMFGDAIFDENTSEQEREFQRKAHSHANNQTEKDSQKSNSFSSGGVPPETVVTTVYKKMNLRDAITRYVLDRRRSSIDRSKAPKVDYKWYGVDKRNIYVKRPDMSMLSRQVTYKNKKTRVLIYCDVSGSVASYTKKFINIVNEIDMEKCEVVFKVWADTVSDVFYNKKGVAKWKNCGGGTSIESVIADYKEKHEKENRVDKIVVLTDGEYSNITNKKKLMKNSTDWVFFMVENSKEKNVFDKSTSVIINW